jgi:hypothetical protein
MTALNLESLPSTHLTRALVRIIVDQYHRMIEQGILPEDAKVRSNAMRRTNSPPMRWRKFRSTSSSISAMDTW